MVLKPGRSKNFLDDLSNSSPAVRLYREGRASGPPENRYKGKGRNHAAISDFWLLPDKFDPSKQDEAIVEEIHALNREMIAAGVRKFACGLGSARTLRAQPNGEVLITDGPYLETKEHVGGFWILETADLDEAVAWAHKGAKACRASVEVRPIFFVPDPKGATD